MKKSIALVFAGVLAGTAAPARAGGESAGIRITLAEAISRSLSHYQGLATKQYQLEAAQEAATSARDAYLPDVTASVQQSFGSVNGAFGPQLVPGAYGIASTGPIAPAQSYNAAFGASYFLGFNWELFTFGRAGARIDYADASAARASADLDQERFVQRVRVAGAYLDLLVAQQLVRVASSNLERAASVESSVLARSRTGLVPEVDRSMASAEVSRARLAVVDAREREQRTATQLAIYLGATARDGDVPAFSLDQAYLSSAPARFSTTASVESNPQLAYQRARVNEADRLVEATSRAIRPGLNLVAGYNLRASGFDSGYTPANGRYSTQYFDGTWPDRSNFIVGLTLSWNLMSPLKNRGATASTKALAAAARSDRDELESQLRNEVSLADARIQNMLELVHEVPLQLSAAEDAYKQKKALYDNGLTTLVDVQQALYALDRAEVDRSVAYAGLWQALLQKSAAVGDFELFFAQAQTP